MKHAFRRSFRPFAAALLGAASIVSAQPADGAIAALLSESGPDVALYDQHINTLANPFFEGRAPGTNGNLLAADYIERYFRMYGLDPAFPGLTSESSYRQSFPFGEKTTLKSQFVQYSAGADSTTLTPGTDYVVTDYSGSGVATGPLAFAGYAIAEGPDGYASFPEGADLSGRVVMLLRFEPMNDQGGSRFTQGQGWSPAASLDAKFKAAAERGAAGILLVSPPEADDERAKVLSPINSMNPVGGALSIPVVMMTWDAGSALVQAAGGSLSGLRAKADLEGGVTEFAGSKVFVATEIEETPIVTANVGAILPGKGDLADQYIVVGAHYDHVGYGEFGSRAGARGRGVIHPGADDNGSGTSGLLLLSKRLSEQYASMPEGSSARSVLFLAFTAEESGLNGSQYYVRNLPFPKEAHTIMLNMDMIGRLTNNRLEVQGLGTAEGLEEIVSPLLESSGLDIARSPGGTGPSDHASFYRAGIPVLFFFTGLHEQYHMPEDVAALINREGAVRVVGLVEQVAMLFATRSEGLVYTRAGRAGVAADTPGPTRLRVRFGIMPGDYSGSIKGVLVGGVTPGTSAEEAGLKEGDLITRWNGTPLDGVEAWMPLLSQHNPGDEVELVFLRDGTEMTAKCKLKAPASRGG